MKKPICFQLAFFFFGLLALTTSAHSQKFRAAQADSVNIAAYDLPLPKTMACQGPSGQFSGTPVNDIVQRLAADATLAPNALGRACIKLPADIQLLFTRCLVVRPISGNAPEIFQCNVNEECAPFARLEEFVRSSIGATEDEVCLAGRNLVSQNVRISFSALAVKR